MCLIRAVSRVTERSSRFFQCRGCNWCHKADASSTAIITGGTSSGVCASTGPDDVLFPDCQDFCGPDSWKEHCKLCKCKACSFCKCDPKDADDSSEQECQPWCTADYYEDHCSRCKCKGCDFCHAGGPPCTPSTPDDTAFKTCQDFCSPVFASSHCGMCKCQGCDFCSADSTAGGALGPGSCTSGITDDVNREMCQDFCDPRERESHCGMCKCRGCEFCKCESEREGDSRVEECQKWCNADMFDDHCEWCSCKGCGFCRAGGKACASFYIVGDTDHEDCEDFCSADALDEHCSYCKCKRCGFCKAAERQAVAPRPPPSAIVAAGSGPACFTGRSGDLNFEACENFCSKDELTEHCKLCKCKSCSMCSASCESGIAGDSFTRWCSNVCDPAQPEAYCSMCKCRSCSFCNADGTPSGAVALPAPEVKEGACTPFNSKDIDHPACLSHCSPESKASHCETCKCKGCEFCQGFQPCSSGKKGDTYWVECDEQWCKSAILDKAIGEQTCAHCKCQGCGMCKAGASSSKAVAALPTGPCESGILDDLDYSTCLAGACTTDLAQAHCQTCRCKACGFCAKLAAAETPPPPPPVLHSECAPVSNDDSKFKACEAFCMPEHAVMHCALCKCKSCSFCSQLAHACISPHIADTKVEQCDSWCDAIGLPKSVMCSFCLCKGCDACEDFHPTKSVVVRSFTKCSIGIEMIIVSARMDSRKNWNYGAKIRLGDWQPGASVKVDFRRQNVEVNTDSVEDAQIEDDDGSVYMFELGAHGDEMKAFSFDFKIIRDGLDMDDGPHLECSNVHEAPPTRPSPPPPPYAPFFRPPPPPPPGLTRSRNSCSLGGKLKIVSKWAGGQSYRAQVAMAIWRPGSEVTLNFAAVLEDPSPVAELFVSHSSNADLLEAPGRGVIRVRLSSSPGESNGFTLVGHGGEIHDHPEITCRIAGQAAAPPPPLAARIGPSCGAMGIAYAVTSHWGGGFRAVVGVTNWQAGAKVSFDFGESVAELIDAQQASRDPEGRGITFVLAERPDPEHHGFGFTIRGDSSSVPTIDCVVDAETLGMIPVPTVNCAMGLAYSVHLVDEDDDEAGSKVRVKVHQWTPTATVTVSFSSKVEVKSVGDMVTEKSNALGAWHTFILGSHPDMLHGFEFTVQSTSEIIVGRVGCRPPPQESASEAEADVKAGSPDAPTGLTASKSGCDSFTVDWTPAVDNGFSVTGCARSRLALFAHTRAAASPATSGVLTARLTFAHVAPRYTVYYRRKDGEDASFQTKQVGAVTSLTLSGLAGATTYYVKLRAKNSHGDGKYSARLTAETLSAGKPHSATAAPEALDSPDCHSLTLSLPPLRAGCRGDSFLSVQSRAVASKSSPAGQWETVVERTAESSAVVHSLDPYVAYEFRSVASNKDGTAPPSGTSGPKMIDAPALKVEPPKVVAVSSASFTVSWGDIASTCRPSIKWRVMYAQATSGTGAAVDWQTFSSDATGGSQMVFPLRCGSPGCRFKVEPIGVQGWALEAVATPPVMPLPLPAVSADAVRVEVRMRRQPTDRDLIALKQELAEDMAAALKLPAEAVRVRDVFGLGMHMVLDLKAAPQGEGETEATSAPILAQQLQLLVEEMGDGAVGGLRRGATSRELDPSVGVLLLTSDGRTTPVHVGNDARAALSRLHRFSLPDLLPFGELSGPALFTFEVASAAILAGCIYTCCRQMRVGRARQTAVLTHGGYGRVARDDDLAAEDDGNEPHVTAKPKARVVSRSLDID